MRSLWETLISEKENRNKNGIYHRMQIDFAYNSNHIEGSRLTHDQTQYIFDTKTVGIGIGKSEDVVKVNDIIETVNHFRCFDHILETLSEPLTEEYIKNLHSILKSGIFVTDSEVVVGDYKKYPNEVGDELTVLPEEVSERIRGLVSKYGNSSMTLYDIAKFHVEYEAVHPFYDGNGRTGRLLMMKQCLENDIVPFFIDDFNKLFYNMGLKEWQQDGKDARLINVFLAAQDDMEAILQYFRIDYQRKETTYREVIESAKKNLSGLSEH